MIDFSKEQQWIESVVDKLKDDNVIIPLYCNIQGNYVKIKDIQHITNTSITPNGVRVIFASPYRMFKQNVFPIERSNEFNIIHSFRREFNGISEVTFIFETDSVDESFPLSTNINEYVSMLYQYIEGFVKRNREEKMKVLFNRE